MSSRRRPDPRHHRGIGNLPRGLVETLAKCIRDDDQISRLVVFGSYARGQATPRSDLDLCVVFRGDESQTVDILSEADVRLYPVMRETGLEYDLVGFPEGLYQHERPKGYRPLLDRIEEEGVELCCNS